MSHRVISGSAKGRRLKLVPGDTTRPIMDRVKEALFNIIGIDIYDATFLDLFAGTGSVGIEALSRGATHAVFNEKATVAIKTIHENLKLTRLDDRATVLQRDAFALLAGRPPRAFDFIFVAPPQYDGLWHRTLQALDANPDWLTEDTQVIVQLDPSEREDTDLTLKHLEAFDERRYGKTMLWFFGVRYPKDE